MARVAVALTCTAEQRSELMALARSRTEEARLVERAKIVLAAWRANGTTRLAASLACGRIRWVCGASACGSWAGRAAGSGSARQDRQIWRGFAPAGSAPTGIAAAQGVGQLGWSFSGRSVGRLGRCGLAPAAQGRRSIAPAALLVRQHRPAICGQGRRYYRSLPEPPGKRPGRNRRRQATDPA